ncbi:hypothetical protein CBR_g37348 [Chara braunii]|uniref:Integrase catalytic domain-containing protein n=1 Tax=Chara braunii TaxID=69332 RepID=A0A388JZP9_CHABU|nr:hypothetical protein CBR_g37348 [Chara braunii]|eukprot:GBG63262.1 hypothetical protein CBR_g37348 [Chara braunii]
MSDMEEQQPDDRILRSARRPVAHLALGPEGDKHLFRQLRERQQQQRRARAAEASRALVSEATASEAMATSAQQTSQAGSLGSVGSTVVQTQSQSTGVMTSQALVLTSDEIAIQEAALKEAQLQHALGQIKVKKERMIRRRARMQRREADVSELEEMDLTHVTDDVRIIRSVLLNVVEFVVMPFGLCNAPDTFQHAMNRIFHDYLDKFVIVYLDDVLIFSKIVEEHVAHLDKVLSLLRQHKFKINGEKCEFGRTRVLYLGHEISAEGLKPDDAKVANIRDWPRPQSVTEMRSFLGMTGYYRTFVKNYSIVVAPLTDLTRLDTPWERTDECEAAFKHLKHALTHYEVLKLPDPDKPFIVTTDASQYGIGAVLVQHEGPKLRPVEYMSKKMPSQKLAKSTYEKELHAVYNALTHWRHYLLGRFFILRTDHQTLRWMRTQSVLSDALKRWIEVIEQYDFDPQYLKGEYNKVADALSCRPDFSGALITEFDLTDNVTQSLVEAYREDQFMSEIIRRLQAKDKKTSAEFELVNGFLFLEKAGNKRLCVPNSEYLRSLFLGECHDATRHFGYKKTTANLLQRFWWPTMMRDAQLYVETCQVCQRDKPHTQAPLGLLKPLPIPERPGESLSMDFMDTLITSKSGMRYTYVIVDRFSKFARLVAMPATAKTEYVIKMFKENWVRDFGLPKSIVSDRDVRFTSELWKAAAAEQGTQLQMTSGNHPESNGQAEQLSCAVQHLLRH